MKQLICFGDSITAGWDGQRETTRLTDRLSDGLGWSVINAGVPGENTTQALARIDRDVLDRSFDRITVLFGANDSSFHKGIPLEQFRKNLVYMARAFSPSKTIFITPSPVIETRQKGKRTNDRISLYAEAVTGVAKETGAGLIDLHGRMLRQSDYRTMLLEDGLHFTDQGYDFLANQIILELKNV